MDNGTYKELLSHIEDKIIRKRIHFRENISPEKRYVYFSVITLHYLTNGCTCHLGR